MSRPSAVSAWRCVASRFSTTTCSAKTIPFTSVSTHSRAVDRFQFPSRSYGTCSASDARSGRAGSSSLIVGVGSRRPTMTTLSSIDVPSRSLTCSLAQRIRYASTTPGLATSSTATATSNKDKDSLEEEEASASDLAKKPAEKIKIGEIRRLMILARPERKTIAIAIGLLFVSSSVSLSIPFTIGRIIDLFSGTAPQGLPISVPTAAALMALFFAIGASANMGRTILMRISGQRIVARLREAAYTNVLKQDIGWHDLQGAAKIQTAELAVPAEAPSSKFSAEVTTAKPPKVVEHQVPQTGVRSTGDIISRLGSDCGIVGESLTRELSEGLRALVTATVGIGAMLWISAKLTAVMMLIVPPISIAAVFYGRYLKKLSRRTQQAVGEMVAVSEERLASIRTVQAFNAVEPLETQRFSEKVDKIFGLAKKEAFASGLFYGGAGFAGNLSLIALLTYGGTLVAKGALTTGQLTSLMVYTFYIGSSLFGLTSFFGTIMKGLGASSRIFELLDARPISVTLGVGKPLPVTTPPRRIIFDDVHFAYPSRPQAEILKGVNLTIEPGQIVSIAGGSGSGKSTLANLLVRYYDPSQGRVVYGEDNIRDFTVESWRQRIAIVPQDPALFSTTIAENIAYGRPNASRAEIKEAAKLANCGFIEALPRGFDTLVGARGAQLSGGQRQRLAIARALLQKPKILVCDEATSALDAASESLVNMAISNISSSHSLTTILIAHRLSTLKTADRVVLMDNGVVVEQGTYEELTRSGTRFSQLVASQMLQGSVTGLPASSKIEARQSL
ncbi:BQ5605_C002g01585 [Microbotryum silenes-dioicae]|uniref:BQ5605_C002g01585 protein n=1 Tax=Microbotryum silenes-dioicae TaxID=796604 RepID=A0A2X0ML46_9BASI|nr:BQ5605_C002g01585 [Microbotryum silenes-dioicae]